MTKSKEMDNLLLKWQHSIYNNFQDNKPNGYTKIILPKRSIARRRNLQQNKWVGEYNSITKMVK